MKLPLPLFGAIFLAAALALPIGLGAVGVGISPTKLVFDMPAGTAKTVDVLVFNSGDEPMEISLVVEGDIAPFTLVAPPKSTIAPEPTPHLLPIKNGKSFAVSFSPPRSSESRRYSGTISAVGTPSASSQLGGSVGVALQVEMTALPGAKALPVTPRNLTIAGVLFALILALLLLKKSGLRLRLERK